MTSLPPIDEVPAAHLEGRALGNGWSVGKRVERDAGATGGYFSISYLALHEDGREGFLKALNFAAAFAGPGSVVDRISEFTDAYKFERDLLQECCDRRMSRVIRLMHHGEVTVPDGGVLKDVPFLIFEMADGDIRAHQAKLAGLDLAWVLRALKHATLGIEQLHAANTAHQDLKPSNVLTQANGSEMKLGDLGMADRRGVDRAWTAGRIPGAVAYAPPEQLYGAFTGSWEERRSADVYLLGSLGIQLFLGHNCTTLIQHALDPVFRVRVWRGSFEEVLPYLRSAHSVVLRSLGDQLLRVSGTPREVADELITALGRMTHPNPAARGHPKDRSSAATRYGVRRFVSLFNRLAETARFAIRLDRSA
jgi:serine/threonine protein kinase